MSPAAAQADGTAGNIPVVPAVALEIEIVTAAIPPYVFQENGQQKGLIVELVEAMARHAGHSAKIRFLPWKRA